jgi:hypothetical protein
LSKTLRFVSNWKENGELPASKMSTLLLFMTIGMRCAILIMVESLNASWIVFWINQYVCTSTNAIASSDTKILAQFRSACPKQNNCFCSTLQLLPSFAIGESSFSDFPRMASSNWHVIMHYITNQVHVSYSHKLIAKSIGKKIPTRYSSLQS